MTEEREARLAAVEVGKRILFRNTLGLTEQLLVERMASDKTWFEGRGVVVRWWQVIGVAK